MQSSEPSTFRFRFSVFATALIAAMGLSAIGHAAQDVPLDFTNALVVTPSDLTARETRAVDMLLDEVETRTAIRWTTTNEWPADKQTIILIGTNASLANMKSPLQGNIGPSNVGPEGFELRVEAHERPFAIVAAHDERGVLFGIGRLLRELRMTRGSITLPGAMDIVTAPKCPLRGHQVGFRPKVNTYDAWTVPMWEQYIRDMAVFGTNAIELIPPRSDDAPDSPHFPLPQIEMMAHQSRLADEYGLDVWIWYPALDKDYSDKKTVDFALAEWGAVFEKMPRIDAIFVPGGDPGHTQPKYMFALLEKATEVLHRTHPDAEMWMSPQSFTGEWTEEFLDIMQNQQPAWLTGIVFGPQNRLSIADLRAAIPKQYRIRHYPDITHSYSCQFPVQDWDTAYKLTEDREVINPRPLAFTEIFRWSLPYMPEFITYSEGVNDDANKMLWSGLGWDPESDPFEILRQYGRYFIGPEYENDFANALFALERNWTGPLLTNANVETTLDQVEELDRRVTPQVRLVWRYQQLLYRAYYDALVRRRLIYETELEQQAMDVLNRADKIGATLAMDEAEAVLNRAALEPAATVLRGRVSDMAEALYHSIRMQLSVPRFQAIEVGRGANFDLIDTPLNNRLWLTARFNEARALGSESAKLDAIRAIVNWTNPGPGGFYDDLGDPVNQPHLVRNVTAEFDPENRTNPLLGYYSRTLERRYSWFSDAETRFEAPLIMKYDRLDPNAEYRIRAVYSGDKFDTQMRLFADDTIPVHDFMDKPQPLATVEFDIPREATADGSLTLTWDQTPGRGSSGRGCQVTEVWLIKKPATP